MNKPRGRMRHSSRGVVATPDYADVRDFELVQPLYDLAFLLELDALAKGNAVPKYRTFSLWRAALHLDGYGVALGRWLKGDVANAALDHPPSPRIRQHLSQVAETGTLAELLAFEAPHYARALQLRAVRGLGPGILAQTLRPDFSGTEWLRDLSFDDYASYERIRSILDGTETGTWQTAHVIPPMLRFLFAIERDLGEAIGCSVHGVVDSVEPIVAVPTISLSKAWNVVEPSIERVLGKEAHLRKVGKADAKGLLLEHRMGWKFRVARERVGSAAETLDEVAGRLDALSTGMDSRILGDLHTHSSWSDGAAPMHTMAEAVAESGLRYFAVTDHSRSSKLQGGLTSVLWLRQAASLTLHPPVCPVLRGIEVDILKDGRLDLPTSLLAMMDLVIGSVHTAFSDDPAVNTARLLAAIESGGIDILAHATSALVGKPGVPGYMRAPAKADWDAVFRKCSEWKVAVEFNCFPSRLDAGFPLLKKALAAGCTLALGSDAHARAHLLHLRFGREVLQRFPDALVLNTLPYDDLLLLISAARARRRTLRAEARPHGQGRLFSERTPTPRQMFPCRLNAKITLPEGSSVVGIDLTAGNKDTGVAFLNGRKIETASLRSDQEILAFVERCRPAIVSIDSPLGLPGGGMNIDSEAGIVRVAERDLSSIGIPAYPALIDSMKPLTLRGIRLKQAIMALPNPPIVLESYPGAAQDILCIPRKQKGLSLLREGLTRLGLSGSGLETHSHDEMDAITSAIVGRYFESGQYEAMGIPSEAQLIVPKASPLHFEENPIICLAGCTAAGKSVVARYLSVFFGFHWIRTRDLIRELLLEDAARPLGERLWQEQLDLRGGITEAALQQFGRIVMKMYDQGPLRRVLARTVQALQAPVVVDAIRDLGDLSDKAREHRPVATWYVDCSDTTIRQRLQTGSKLGIKRITQAPGIDSRLKRIAEAADRTLTNDGTLEALRWQIDDALFASLKVLPGR